MPGRKQLWWPCMRGHRRGSRGLGWQAKLHRQGGAGRFSPDSWRFGHKRVNGQIEWYHPSISYWPQHEGCFSSRRSWRTEEGRRLAGRGLGGRFRCGRCGLPKKGRGRGNRSHRRTLCSTEKFHGRPCHRGALLAWKRPGRHRSGSNLLNWKRKRKWDRRSDQAIGAF